MDIKKPLFDGDAEKAVLASMVTKPSSVPDILENLSEVDFYMPHHRKYFTAAKDLFKQGVSVDIVSLVDHIRRTGSLDQGDTTRIAGLSDGSVIPSRSHAGIVKRYSRSRAFLKSIDDAKADLQAGLDIDNVIQGFSTAFDTQNATSSKITAVSELAETSLQQIDDRAANGGGMAGISTGYVDIDNLLSGLVPTNLIILAARPSMGKTTLALNIAENLARARKTVAFFSLEMSKGELMEKLISRISRAPLSRIRNGTFSSDERLKIGKAVKDIKTLPLHLLDRPALTATQVTAAAKGLAMRGGIDLLIVDYLQLMRGTGQNREREIAQISGELKQLAMSLNIPILALSQLNRGLESRTDKHPMLADLRDSGAIEQDANAVLFLYRDEVYSKEQDNPLQGIAEVIVAKNRAGATGTARIGSSRLSYSEFVSLSNKTS
ncbi:replicative DNA helicase [Desulfopila sp. IMCC35008]|uniref:replicative DNA helicase n=1 Tax=Desulfopila sp. IMCC35008 TaxID=2653858 RepID=UPI0013D78920|nr:replicative DNA helicase [Desulfopila sp. IMCC35008]